MVFSLQRILKYVSVVLLLSFVNYNIITYRRGFENFVTNDSEVDFRVQRSMTVQQMNL